MKENKKEKPKSNKPNTNNSFIYFVSAGRFSICDLDCCLKSKRTIDVQLFDIANNEKLLNILHLYYIVGNYGVRYTYQSRAEWFCGYLSSFNSVNKVIPQYEKSITNPVVRILIEDESLMDAVLDTL